MQFRAKQIAPPKEWGAFEDLCHALFKRVWNDPLAQKNGRRGQRQHGVDVFGSKEGDRSNFQGVQCKGKNANYGSIADWSEILAEITKACKFLPELQHWIYATTAPVDATLQRLARELSVERRKLDLFSVDVLGWEEIQVLMADAPEVIAQFYPEHADHLPEVIETLRSLPSLEAKLSDLVSRLDAKVPTLANPHGNASWERVTFDGNRGLGPALMGYSLGPSDAAACPRLPEVSTTIAQLKVGYSARIVGEPGSGKSICSYQVARDLVLEGFEVVRLIDPEADGIVLEAVPSGVRRLCIIDDAHLLRPQTLSRIEEQAGPAQFLLSTHNAVGRISHRGSITLDAKRAVKAIAAALRSDLPRTLKAVRMADPNVGHRMIDSDLAERLDQAEDKSDRPWQFCFVLGGGWRRSREAADAARAVKADVALAGVAIRQMVSRDARATAMEIAELCSHAKIDGEQVGLSLEWLEHQRLILGHTDCRTPHQRFASVVLKRILEGQDKEGRKSIAAMIEAALCDPQFPYAGMRLLINELRFDNGNYLWTRLLSQNAIDAAISKCWAAEGPDRSFASMALTDLWAFVEGGAERVVTPRISTLSAWISRPNDSAYGLGYLLNNLTQRDPELAKAVLAKVDPTAIAQACSSATPDTAYGLADLMACVANAKADGFREKVLSALDRDKLRELATHDRFVEEAFTFGKFCASVSWWDEALALEMAELFVPTAQRILSRDPVDGFDQLSRDFASTVLRVFDVLKIYVGKLKPSPRQWAIARKICATVDPKLVAQRISAVQPRQFQSAAFFLHFLRRTVPRKFEAALHQMDWEKLNCAIGDDWTNMPHDTEVLLAALHSNAGTRSLVQDFIATHADRIIQFPPRLMLMAPEVGINHLEKGGFLRLATHDNVRWDFGGIALALIAQSRPDLLEQSVAPFIRPIARSVSNYNRDNTGPAEGLIRVMIDHAPVAWLGVLALIEPAIAENNLVECLKIGEDHRRTAAVVIESAQQLPGPVGDMARRLRKQFSKTSVAPTGQPQFSRRRARSSRKVKRSH